MSCRAPVAGLTAQPVYPRVASTVSPAPQLRAMRVAMGRKIPGRRFASFRSVRRLFMVRHMKLRGRNGILGRSEEHTSELQSLAYLVCRLLLGKKKVYLTI